MALLLLSAFWQLRGSFTAIAGLALATAVVSRLFSILNLKPPASIAGLSADDLDALVATGPGVPGFELLGWFLGVSNLSPGLAQRRLALAVVLALLVAFFITAGPLSTIQLARIDAFIPA